MTDVEKAGVGVLPLPFSNGRSPRWLCGRKTRPPPPDAPARPRTSKHPLHPPPQPAHIQACQVLVAYHSLRFHQHRFRRRFHALQVRALPMCVPASLPISPIAHFFFPVLDELSFWLRSHEYGHAILFFLIFLTTIRKHFFSSFIRSTG